MDIRTIIACITLMVATLSISITSGKQKDIREIFDHIVYTDEPIASSELVEKGLPKDFYSAKKAIDGNKDTAWVEGIEGDGIGEYIMFNLNFGSIPSYGDFDNNKFIIVDIIIVNGVAKNEKLFKMNNRIKKATLEVYESEVSIRQIDPWVVSEQVPILNSTFEIELKDIFEPQRFRIRFKPKQKPLHGPVSSFLCIGKLIIKEIYPGTKYKDTGISEIKARRIDEE
ncbi:MAG: hypothetical protein N3F66_14965 [Spirochaetes bacterium]|nr:hypothetical protein [Spirochaetota bacterium]